MSTENMQHSLATKAPICNFMFVSDVTPQTGGGGKGILTLITRKLFQSLCKTSSKSIEQKL